MSVDISIEYCAAWNYEPQAVGLAEKLLKLKEQIRSLKLVPSGGGVFEISVNGKNIYSKLQTGKFPEPDAVVQMVRASRWFFAAPFIGPTSFRSDFQESEGCLVAPAVFKTVVGSLHGPG
jgi:selenoprotein W-related protein